MTSTVDAQYQVLNHKRIDHVGNENNYSFNASWNNSRVGDDDPLWREKVAKGINATNNYTCYERRYVEVVPMSCLVERWGPYGLYSWTDIVGLHGDWITVPDTVVNPTVTNEVYAKFNERVSNFISPFKGMTFLGELRESVKMVRDRTRRILTGVIDFKKAYRSEIERARKNINDKTLTRDVLKRASDSWLEYAFGWAPLAGDLEKACEVLNTNKSVFRKVSAKADLQEVVGLDSNTNTGYPFNDYAHFSWYKRQTKHSFSRVVGVVDLRLLRHQPANLPVDLGLTLQEFVPTLWELVPYSFLVDYFSNVGDIIGGVFTESRALAWISQTDKCLARSEFTANLVSLHQGPYDWASLGRPFVAPRLTILARSLNRFTPTNTIPSFQLGYPDLGSTKYLNMVALLLSRLNV